MRQVDRRGGGIAVSLPAPVGGWNTRDSIDNMPPQDAVDLENWFPDSTSVDVREGYQQHATGVGSNDVETLITWRGATGQKLLAAGDGEIYDASAEATASAITSSANYTNDRWQWVTYNGFVTAVNGDDTGWNYNGSSLTNLQYTGSGLTVSNLINVTVYKDRLYFAEKNSAKLWYSGVGEVGTGSPTLTDFDLGQIARRGGKLQAVASWSPQTSDGLQDLFVAIMDTGEILVYAGTYPGDSSWAIQGSYYAGPPLGRRCAVNIGGDLILVTEYGYIPLSFIVQGGTADQLDRSQIWGKIRRAATDAAVASRDNNGWQPFVSATGEKLIINVPTDPNSNRYDQHVLNLGSGGWCKFTGIPSTCWAVYDGTSYLGGDSGKVYKLGGASDDGSNIVARAKQAFTYIGGRGQQKRFTAARPVVAVDGAIDAGFGIDVDFSSRNLPSVTTNFFGSSAGEFWDEADWDTFFWADEITPSLRWVSVQGVGRNVAPRFEVRTGTNVVRWYSTDILGQPAAIR